MRELMVCMYGGASERIHPVYKEKVEEFGRKLGESGHGLIFGAGGTGLMGACAKGVRSAGGKVVGVFPKFMPDIEPQFEGLTQIIKTDNMAQRKGVMENNADIFVICPGGVGTLDEFFQILTLNELKRHSGEIIIFNINEYYAPLMNTLQIFRDQGFIRPDFMDFLNICATADEVMEVINRVARQEE